MKYSIVLLTTIISNYYLKSTVKYEIHSESEFNEGLDFVLKIRSYTLL